MSRKGQVFAVHLSEPRKQQQSYPQQPHGCCDDSKSSVKSKVAITGYHSAPRA